MEVIHPFTFPIFIFQLFNFMDKAFADLRVAFQHGDHVSHIGFCIIQANDIGIAPQTGFTRQWLEDRIIVGVLKSDRHSTTFYQNVP